MLLVALNDECLKTLSSTMLIPAQIVDCHGWALVATVAFLCFELRKDAYKCSQSGGEWWSNQTRIVLFEISSRKFPKCKMELWEKNGFWSGCELCARAFQREKDVYILCLVFVLVG